MTFMITLTLDEVNYVLSALGQRPFAEVSELLNKIKSEAEAQFALKQSTAVSEEVPDA